MNERPSVLQVLEQVVNAWLAGQKPALPEVTFLGNYIAEEKQKAAAPVAASAPTSEG